MNKPARLWLKPLVDYVPLVVFLIFYWRADLFAATAALMITATCGVILSYVLERSVPTMPLVTAGLVLVFGGLTLALDDERFIKMKPTIVQTMFAAVMFGGLLFDKPVLKPLFGRAWQLQDDGWRKLTMRFGLFFIAAAALNEVIWRTQSTDVWVNFKVFGLMGMTLMFVMTQIPLIQRYQIRDDEAATPKKPAD